MNLPTGSLAKQVEKQNKEFREFAKFVAQFMTHTQRHFRDTKSAFATALHNHEIRIKELEAKLVVVPVQEIQEELEQQILENAEEPEVVELEPVEVEVPVSGTAVDEPESKVKFHKEY